MPRRALLLSGSLGLGHDAVAAACATSLADRGWQTRMLDSMALLGGAGGRAGDAAFRRLMKLPGVYDGLHYAHLRQASPMAHLADRLASAQVVPRLRAALATEPADLLLSVFATGASAAARLKAEDPQRLTAVLCTDTSAHALWVHEGTDLFLVTSNVAGAWVRRFWPRARVAVVPPPIRRDCYDPPAQEVVRAAYGVPPADPCVLLMSGGWGLGPLAEVASALAMAGVWVLAVAGHNAALATQLRTAAAQQRRIVPFGFTDHIPALMAAADLVITASGDTCYEARVVGRDLLILDVVPGHGRDNLAHQLELGQAEVTGVDPAAVTASALACLDRRGHPYAGYRPSPAEWESAFSAALAQIGLD